MSGQLWIRFFLLPIYRPVEGMRRLFASPRKLTYSIVIFLFLGLLYTCSVQWAWQQGIAPPVEPFLKIPAEAYYRWQRFWQIPFFFLTTILFAGTVRLLSALGSGRGNFVDLFCLFAVAQTLPMFLLMWLPETIGILFFPARAIMPVWLDVTRQVAGLIWPFGLCVIGIARVEQKSWPFSLLVTLLAALPVAGLMVIFIR